MKYFCLHLAPLNEIEQIENMKTPRGEGGRGGMKKILNHAQNVGAFY